jgi:chromosome segregation ATPase
MKAAKNKTRLTEEVVQLKSQLRESQQKRSTLEEKAQLLEERVGTLQKQYEAQEMAKHIRANDLENARREVERQTSQVTALRQDLERVHSDRMAKDEHAMRDVTALRHDLDLARSEAKARDKDVKELEKKLEVVGDEQRRREQELQALLNKRSEEATALGKELADAQGQLTQITTDSDRMHNGMTEVRNSACRTAFTILMNNH